MEVGPHNVMARFKLDYHGDDNSVRVYPTRLLESDGPDDTDGEPDVTGTLAVKGARAN